MNSILPSRTTTPAGSRPESALASAFKSPPHSNSTDSSTRDKLRPASRSQVTYTRPATALGTQTAYSMQKTPGRRSARSERSENDAGSATRLADAKMSRPSSRQGKEGGNEDDGSLWAKRLRNQRVYLARSDSKEGSLSAVRRRAQSARVMPAEPQNAHTRPASSVAALRSSSPGSFRHPLTATDAAAAYDSLASRNRTRSPGATRSATRSKSALPHGAGGRQSPESGYEQHERDAFSPIPGAPGRGLLLSSKAIDDSELSLFHTRIRDTSRRCKSVPPARLRRCSPLQVRAVDLSASGGAYGSAALMSTR